MRNIEINEQLDYQHFNKLLYRMLAIANPVLKKWNAVSDRLDIAKVEKCIDAGNITSCI